MTKLAGVFAQPVVDQFGAKLLRKWYDGGTRAFIGWASIRNTSGANPSQDRSAQLEFRDAVRALGPDAGYFDYPLPDWRNPAAPADLAMMINDPQCFGFMAPDEFNRKNSAGTDFVVTAAQWKAFWDPIDAADPTKKKIRFGDYSGSLLSSAWGYYTGADMIPYAARLTMGCTNWHPRNVYGSDPGHADCDIYAGRAVHMLRQIAHMPRAYICEIANEKLNSTGGRAPVSIETLAQYNGVMAEDNPDSPIQLFAWFPQEPHPNASHIFDATTPAQFETVKQFNAKFAPVTPIPPQPMVEQRLAKLEAWAASFKA